MNAERQEWFEKHKKYFYPKDISTIESSLECVDDYTFALIQTADYKNPKTALLLAIFLGYFGADAFYKGRYIKGFIKLGTGGGFFIWNIIDIFTVKSLTMKENTEEWNNAIGAGQSNPHPTTNIDVDKIKEFTKSKEFKNIAQNLKSLDDNMYANIAR